MSKIPQPARPVPRSTRTPFAQPAATTTATPGTVASESTATSPDAPATVTRSATSPATPRQRKAAPASAKPATEKKRKAQTTDILLSLEEELKDRMVAALEHTRPRTGIKSQQVFIRTAIDQLCTKLETQYNNGEPFPAPADEIAI
ncbi:MULTISPECIES: hypothetical protein [unclassified Rhodococcus (in: high G+C Gram-positive bacteria)]|uniref:hypothetical protein n=1 Tax=unclassified Rhodococcus (in: high G+C Gram-positive bacteria) TaxID=192944 RepID=UPI002078A839|nr:MULTISPECIES: hypothetical protein [unclassified Rhodococcus (in: high G+C Gram-positive bacteria)]